MALALPLISQHNLYYEVQFAISYCENIFMHRFFCLGKGPSCRSEKKGKEISSLKPGSAVTQNYLEITFAVTKTKRITKRSVMSGPSWPTSLTSYIDSYKLFFGKVRFLSYFFDRQLHNIKVDRTTINGKKSDIVIKR